MPAASSSVIVYGGGGHAKVLLDLLAAIGGYRVAGVVDDHLEPGSRLLGCPVLGGKDVLSGLVDDGVSMAVNGVGGVGRPQARRDVFDRLAEAGFTCPTVAHPRALVERSAFVEDGVQIMAQAYVGSATRIGFGSLINTAAVVNHDCILGRHVGISPGALLAGNVTVGDGASVGMGATVNIGVVIGEGARIGNSAVVKSDVAPGAVVHAGQIWPDRRPGAAEWPPP